MTLSSTDPVGKPAAPFPCPALRPTQSAPHGVRFDFNDGCRVSLPSKGNWRVRFCDLDTGNTLFDAALAEGSAQSTKKYFVRFGLEVWRDNERALIHEFDCAGRPVLILFPVGTLGDSIGWLPYAIKFQAQHGCQLTCAMAATLIPLFAPAYPDITFVTPESVQADDYYATYRIGLFFDDVDSVMQPCDFRLVGLHRTAGHILGVDPTECPPLLATDDRTRPIAEPYVCIATQSTTQCKYWNNPNGWRDVIACLKTRGYRVICIDQKPVHGNGMVWNHLPHGAEDQTGDRPLPERARWLRHAAAFIGLSSGLAWLAWAAGTPVVMISGFSLPFNEFTTPHRVINYHTCNGCWNDVRHRFDHHDFLWCPRHQGTPRQFECTRLITAQQVIATIQKIPDFQVLQSGHSITSKWIESLK